MKTKLGETILEFLILLSFIIMIINTILYFVYKNQINIFIILISLFFIGILTLILVLKYGDKEDNYNDYIVLEKEEYDTLKNTLYRQDKDIKKQKQIINKIKTIVK